jgi:hypothetical protein
VLTIGTCLNDIAHKAPVTEHPSWSLDLFALAGSLIYSSHPTSSNLKIIVDRVVELVGRLVAANRVIHSVRHAW